MAIPAQAKPDQRTNPRRSVQGVRCRVGAAGGWVWVPATIIDFSTSGIRLRVPLAWEAGETRRLRISAGAVRLDLAAAAIWSRSDGRWRCTVGAAFRGVTAAEEALLAEVLDRHGVQTPFSQAA